ncbi:hypothetical protein E2C01_053294 [Portunus trituberculatus]|uniref:Uncharacterized protein n=1 Tax=Portunus trituberculatus TaxID=210409 RepID=A0A5B7GPY1_PORTR|nr:hypothetical protein [Portunus trituberculatus]
MAGNLGEEASILKGQEVKLQTGPFLAAWQVSGPAEGRWVRSLPLVSRRGKMRCPDTLHDKRLSMRALGSEGSPSARVRILSTVRV